MKGSCIILQSGGPTSVINASLYGVIMQAKKEEKITNVYGSLCGIEGVLNDNLIDFGKEDEKELKYLLTTPSSALGSSRFRLPQDINDPIYEKVVATFKKYDVRYFFLIGGNDSMDTANKVSRLFKNHEYACRIIGVPKTIDNDLVLTDHTPGYGSAVKYIANVFAEMSVDIACYKKGKVTIVEVMGRDAGWLTAGSKLACTIGCGPDLIYLPESPFDVQTFLKDVQRVYDEKKRCLVAVSEGVRDRDGKYIVNTLSEGGACDDFGHMQLGGTASVLSKIVETECKLPVRAVELNLPQRCSAHIASATDVREAQKCGEKGVKIATAGKTGQMVIMKRAKKGYRIGYSSVPLHKIANQVKAFPKEWIVDGKDITEDFIDYCKPLIEGEMKYPYQNGLPRFVQLKKTKAE